LPERASEHAQTNRAYWDRTSDDYQQRHREFIGRPEPRWGVWQIRESELDVLGEIDGKDVLELGCGAAHWSILLAKQGARPVGLDNSARQLEHARERLAEAGVDFPLVHASAEDIPLPDQSFDVVFCDHGAFTFADPYKVVPEAARLLRPGGLLAFSHSSPFVAVCEGEDERVHPALTRDYFGLHEQNHGDVVTYELPYGEWIRLFRSNGFIVEGLIEPRPEPDATSTYWDEEEREWARRWPCESIWKARKAA
jgi:ubiquinone/menaquinone biosynthesis C-methylase UbiE